MQRRGILENKRGAFELSVTTMIIIVLAITMLIMGLVLIRNIFGGATESIDSLSSKVKTEIDKIFTDENKKIVVYLGEDRTAKVKAGTDLFGIAIGAKTATGSRVQARSDLQYKMELDETARENCAAILGKTQTTNLFKQDIGEWTDFDEFQGDTSKSIIQIGVPEGTTLCSQKIFIEVRDRSVNPEGEIVGGDFFIVQVTRKGVF